MNTSCERTIKVLVADDHQIVREGLRSCLMSSNSFESIDGTLPSLVSTMDAA